MEKFFEELIEKLCRQHKTESVDVDPLEELMHESLEDDVDCFHWAADHVDHLGVALQLAM